jgi:hypothetical protein
MGNAQAFVIKGVDTSLREESARRINPFTGRARRLPIGVNRVMCHVVDAGADTIRPPSVKGLTRQARGERGYSLPVSIQMK